MYIIYIMDKSYEFIWKIFKLKGFKILCKIYNNVKYNDFDNILYYYYIFTLI